MSGPSPPGRTRRRPPFSPTRGPSHVPARLSLPAAGCSATPRSPSPAVRRRRPQTGSQARPSPRPRATVRSPASEVAVPDRPLIVTGEADCCSTTCCGWPPPPVSRRRSRQDRRAARPAWSGRRSCWSASTAVPGRAGLPRRARAGRGLVRQDTACGRPRPPRVPRRCTAAGRRGLVVRRLAGPAGRHRSGCRGRRRSRRSRRVHPRVRAGPRPLPARDRRCSSTSTRRRRPRPRMGAEAAAGLRWPDLAGAGARRSARADAALP